MEASYYQLQEKIFEWVQDGEYGIYILSTTSEIFYIVENARFYYQ